MAAGHRPRRSSRAPPRRAGRHRHRQVARLPRARAALGPADRRRDRHEGAAGPAREEGSAVPRAHLGHPFTFAVLKGRSNYVCRQRLAEMSTGTDGRARLGVEQARPRCATRCGASGVGGEDRAPAIGPSSTFEPTGAAWTAVSVGCGECPGAHRVPDGRRVLRREGPPRRATPTSSWSTSTSSARPRARRIILPDHDVVVIDEAHQIEDIVAATAGSSRPRQPLPGARHPSMLADPELTPPPLDDVGDRSGDVIAGLVGERAPAAVGRRPRRRASLSPAPRSSTRPPRCARCRTTRPRPCSPASCAQKAVIAVLDAVDILRDVPDDGRVGRGNAPSRPSRGRADRRREVLASRCGRQHRGAHERDACRARYRAVSACRPTSSRLDVGSPVRLPGARAPLLRGAPPRSAPPGLRSRAARELEALIVAAGGRTLALFTSWGRCRGRRAALRPGRAVEPVLAQGDLPKPASARSLRRGAHVVPVRHDGLLAGRRRARPDRCRS